MLRSATTGPVLVAAAFDALSFGLTLTFDRGVDVGLLAPAAFAVDDGVAGVRSAYLGSTFRGDEFDP